MKFGRANPARGCSAFNGKLALNAELLRFLVVGAVGFVIDGGVLTVLMSQKVDAFSSRLVSFPCAVSVTWILNRYWTFSPNPDLSKKQEYFAYFTIQLIGALINLSIFFALMRAVASFADIPLIPLAIGALVSFLFTYLSSKMFLFKKRRNDEGN